MGAVSKYNPLLQYLARSDALYLKFSFTEIEKILGAPIPQSARRYSAWWANHQDGRHVQAASWMDAGFRTENLDLTSETVSFRKVPELDERFVDALSFAREKHHGFVRKGTRIPYLSHLLAVASLAIEDAASDPLLDGQFMDIAVAAVLHDVVEDTPVSVGEVADRFGSEVARIVESCSDAEGVPKPPWRKRKETYIRHLEDVDQAVLCVALADKRHNARCIVNAATELGSEVWNRFNAGPKEQIWYYSKVAEVLTRRRPGLAAQELSGSVARLCDLAGAQILGIETEKRSPSALEIARLRRLLVDNGIDPDGQA